MAKLLGVNSDTSVCECCGKTNLKRVAVIELNNGQIVRYGRDCAARKLGKSFGKGIDAAVTVAAEVEKITAFINKFRGQHEDTKIANACCGRFFLPVEYKNGQFIIHESRDKKYAI